MEVRYSVPYISGLSWVLNDPIKQNVQRQNDSGQPVTEVITTDPGLTVEITPYLGKVKGKTKVYEFKSGDDTASMEDVLTAAGLDVAAAWASSLDKMANIFPILKDPVDGDEKFGPAFYIRLDAWRANLSWEGNQVVVATLGLYDTADFKDVQAYVQLVFADGKALKNRDGQKSQLEEQKARYDSILLDEPTYPDWDTLTEDQQTQLTTEATQNLPNIENNLAQINSQLVAPLADLFADEDIQTSIGALAVGTFSVLKVSDPVWADIDVMSIISRFSLPDVS